MTPEVLFIDNHLLVVNKPAGMLAQEDETGDLDVITWAKHYLKERFNKPGNVFAGLVHRLDRPASGVMVIARTSKAAGRLADTFRNRQVDKTYLALVEGVPPDQGQAVDHLAKVQRKVKVVRPTHPEGKKASLTWTLRGNLDGFSLVEVKLDTGRPHQIRVQMASRGWPLVGDVRYGAKREFDGRNLALHAWKLGLEHPVRREPQAWTAAPGKRWPMWVREMVG
ncbi:MAG: RNA pseudouridine synthase [Rhodothermales bacterium]|nr:RNA pseudouridine synthase [Rhodothermales bacterium]